MSEQQSRPARVSLWWASADLENMGTVLDHFAGLGTVSGVPREVARRTKLPWEIEPEGYYRVTYEADVIPHGDVSAAP